jgi:tRNA threonylcarbamoyladenosine biosynthesis protein TsaB
MRALALDTTTRAGSLAIIDADRLVEERISDALRPHAERLPGEAIALLSAHGLSMADVDLFAVASGPGSFTGLRIGIATIQGLAFVRERPVVAVSALEALAQIGSRDLAPGDLVAAWIDAHRREVFSALYRVGRDAVYQDGRLIELEGPMVGDPAATVARWRDRIEGAALTLIGDATPLYGATAAGMSGTPFKAVPAPPIAAAIGRIALERARTGCTINAAGIQPLYVRRPDAEVARDKAMTLNHE